MNIKLKDLIKRNPVLLNTFRRIKAFTIRRSSFTKYINGVGNQLRIDPSVISLKSTISINGNNNYITICPSVVLKNVKFYISGNNNNIHISKNVIFNHGGTIWMEDNNGTMYVGENSTFEDVHFAVTEPHSKISVGKDCMFARNVELRTGDSHSIIDQKTNKRINYAQNVEIGDHVWVAGQVSILKGTVIASNSVVATRAVVTHKFETGNVLLAGMPAKVIKEDINWNRQRIYDVLIEEGYKCS